jgi:CoA:oxalate CoA-transferase
MPTPTSGGPLDGFRVLDFTNFLAGPYCTRILADMGAEVIKIESPSGDQSRHLHPIKNGQSIRFAHLYAGKKSVVLDLKSPAGQKAAFDLGKKSDVIVESWRPGVAKRLGLDFEAISVAKPDIVYCSISGYGQTGPDAKRAAYAPMVEALSGYTLAQMALDRGEKPQTCGLMQGDTLTSVWSFAAIQTALLQRERTGRGQFIDVGMLHAMQFAMLDPCHAANFGAFTNRFHPPVKTRDGYMIVSPISETNFKWLAQALEHPEWLEDPRLNPLTNRNSHWGLLMQFIEDWTSQRSTDECEAILQAGGVPCCRFRSYKDAMQDPQTAARGTFTSLKVAGGEYKLPNVPFKMPGVATEVRPLLSDLGQHNGEILRDVLGYTDDEIHACNAVKSK